jgi:hypothetical protein
MLTKLHYTVSANLIQEALNSLPTVDMKSTINTPNGNFFYDPWIIKSEYQNTVWQSILESLPLDIGEARIIILDPGQCYQCHADIDDRYHLNLSGSECFLIDIDSQTMHETTHDGVWYEMDASPKHSAANYGQVPRVQLVVRKLLTNNKLVDPVTVQLTAIRLDNKDARFCFDQFISGWLNKANKRKTITNFRYSPSEVLIDIERHEINELEKLAFPEFEMRTV